MDVSYKQILVFAYIACWKSSTLLPLLMHCLFCPCVTTTNYQSKAKAGCEPCSFACMCMIQTKQGPTSKNIAPQRYWWSKLHRAYLRSNLQIFIEMVPTIITSVCRFLNHHFLFAYDLLYHLAMCWLDFSWVLPKLIFQCINTVAQYLAAR